MSPSVLTTSPRDAISPGVPTTTSHEQLAVVDGREGVPLSPLAGESKDEKKERLPLPGKGGMVQLASDGNVSMLVLVGNPPLMINPA